MTTTTVWLEAIPTTSSADPPDNFTQRKSRLPSAIESLGYSLAPHLFRGYANNVASFQVYNYNLNLGFRKRGCGRLSQLPLSEYTASVDAGDERWMTD